MISRIVVLLVALGGCEIMYEPDVGPQRALEVDAGTTDGSDVIPAGRCGDSDPAVAVSFSRDIRPLTSRSPGGCLGCHGAGSTSGFSLGSYESLRRGGTNSGLRILVPGDPCASVLVQKLGLAPPFGVRMPYNGPPYYSAAELTLLADWVAEGALNN